MFKSGSRRTKIRSEGSFAWCGRPSRDSSRWRSTFRRETKALEISIQGGNTYQLTLDGIIASRGGIPLIEGGKVIGAIGCSGGTGSQDEVSCTAGAATIK